MKVRRKLNKESMRLTYMEDYTSISRQGLNEGSNNRLFVDETPKWIEEEEETE
jgi:hypothetical protein